MLTYSSQYCFTVCKSKGISHSIIDTFHPLKLLLVGFTHILCEGLIPVVGKQIIQVTDWPLKLGEICEPQVWVSILLQCQSDLLVTTTTIFVQDLVSGWEGELEVVWILLLSEPLCNSLSLKEGSQSYPQL